jgi:CHASE2 domain-containing sensor protein
MSHGIWLPSSRQRMLSILMVILAATGYRRWLSRPWQWSLRDYMVIVAVCSAGLLVSRSPMPMIVFFTALAGALLACLSLARHGFKLVDITTLLAIILLTAAVILPAMERTRNRTLGTSVFPFAVPARYITLFSGSE